jgi:hypothetical protein
MVFEHDAEPSPGAIESNAEAESEPEEDESDEDGASAPGALSRAPLASTEASAPPSVPPGGGLLEESPLLPHAQARPQRRRRGARIALQ